MFTEFKQQERNQIKVITEAYNRFYNTNYSLQLSEDIYAAEDAIWYNDWEVILIEYKFRSNYTLEDIIGLGNSLMLEKLKYDRLIEKKKELNADNILYINRLKDKNIFIFDFNKIDFSKLKTKNTICPGSTYNFKDYKDKSLYYLPIEIGTNFRKEYVNKFSQDK